QDHHEWVAEILIVNDHQQVDEYGGEQQSDAEIAEGITHALDLSENPDRVAGLELLLQLGDDLADVTRNAAEIAALHAGIDVVHRLNIGLVQIGWNALALECRHIAQQPRYRRAVGGERGRYWRVANLVERAHQAFRSLDRDVIGNPGDGIGPEVGRDLLRRAQADIEVIGDSLRAEPQLQRARPVDVHHEGRRIELLLEMSIGDTRNARETAAPLPGHAPVGRTIATNDLNVDLRRQSEIEDLGDHVGGLEIKGRGGE